MKNTLKIIIISIILTTVLFHLSFADIPDTERQALIDFYTSNEGDNWENNFGWLGSHGTECYWYGVSCNIEKTHVIQLGFNEQNNLLTQLPSSIHNLTRLNRIDFKKNTLISLPPEMGSLNHLRSVELSLNPLTSLPPEMGNLINLSELYLHGNHLTNLPIEIQGLISLYLLDLSDNQLKSIPPEMGNLTNMGYLHLENNHLTTLPEEIETLKGLYHFSIDHNCLKKLVPEIGRLRNLSVLYLNGNQLTSIPVEMTQLTKIQALDIGCNAIEVSEPELIEFLDKNDVDWKQTQTVSPKQLTVTTKTNCSVTLAWSVIDYTHHQGGYEVYYSESSSEPYSLYDITDKKTIEQMTITGLQPDTTYDCSVRSVTYPHTAGERHDNNNNTVYSQFSKKISAKTYSLASIKHLKEWMNSSNIQLEISGDGITAYKYKFKENDWSEELSIATPLSLTSLQDRAYSLVIACRYETDSWQIIDKTYHWTVDTKLPEIIDLSDTTDQVVRKTWHWQADETNCLFRYAIDQNQIWSATGDFEPYTHADISEKTGIWYLHVQAKDAAGNLSAIKTVSVEFQPPIIEFLNAFSDDYECYTQVNLELVIDRTIDHDIWVEYDKNISEPSAVEWLDYYFPSVLNVMIPAGELKAFIPLTIIDDSFSELNETITIQLNRSNATIGRKKHHTYTIKDDDYPGITIQSKQDQLSIVENSDPKSLTILLNSKPEYHVDISLIYDDELIDIDTDRLSFHTDNWNVPHIILIAARNDHVYKGDIDIDIQFLISSKDSQYHATTHKISINIHDDDPKPSPPEITGPTSPYNSKSPRWCWRSWSGSQKFRYKIDDDNLSKGAVETELTCYQHPSGIIDGNHVFYVQEYYTQTQEWSASAEFNLEIDTGLPSSDAQSPSEIDTQNPHFEITYTCSDSYSGELYGSTQNTGSGIKRVELWGAAPNETEYALITTDIADEMDGKFEYIATDEGVYRFITRAVDLANNKEFENIPNPEEEYTTETILVKHIPENPIIGDMNNNNRVDTGDAILCLQLISGVDIAEYIYDPEVLQGNYAGLRDAIYIMKFLSERHTAE